MGGVRDRTESAAGRARPTLAETMERLAAGDPAAVVDLYRDHGDRVAGTVRALLRHRGVSLGADEVDGLVLDACLAIAAVAAAWSPDGGALPWTWARRRIENCVDRVVGQRTVPLDEHVAAVERRSVPVPPAQPASERPLVEALAALAAADERCRLLAEAFDRAALTPLDREVCLAYAVEQGDGNRAPAVTVGTWHGLREAAVRQRVRRSRGRLRRLAADDPAYAGLADMPLVAGQG
jgi:DNA-directed RNA polymerase specialized sigma24 family protein